MRTGFATLLTVTLALQLASCGACRRFAYEGFGRDDWQQPDEVIALLEIPAGAVVADLGAGGGYFTFKLAAAVGGASVVATPYSRA